ncbi:hypothetical protein QCD79_31870, partial [Pseudomonas quasicaspiana]|nr:hypothetical protein [Pseudomonas quasicaspiana]
CVRLYSEEDFNGRPEFTDPEILRTNLAAVILQMLHLRDHRGEVGAQDFRIGKLRPPVEIFFAVQPHAETRLDPA